jgi:AcrR family transcriptional regulator
LSTTTTSSKDSSPAYRRQPKQLRGQRRVEQILREAEAVFAEVGFENATTNAIAERAGISIGSLYQFFSSKESILEAMAERYLAQTLKALENRLKHETKPNLDDLVIDLIALLIKLQERRPYFLQCLVSNRPSPVLARAVNEINDALADHVYRLFERMEVPGDSERLKLRARICVETMGALLPFVVYAKGRRRTMATQEIRRLLVGYMSQIAEEETV